MKWGTKKEIYRHKCMMLLKHRYLYYVLNDPEITDIQYDKMEKQLQQFESDNSSMVHPHSPTRTVGSSDVSSYPKSIRMLYQDRKKVKKIEIKATKGNYQII